MVITEKEAAEMYARACRSWYGTKAKSVVRAKIRALKAKGDDKGVEAWERVARALVQPNIPTQVVGPDQTHPQELEMTSGQRCELVSHFLKTRHGIEVCRRRVAKLINGNPMIDEKTAPHHIAMMIKSHLEVPASGPWG
jgi:hypothetical protein